MAGETPNVIRPQPGPQERFLASPADIVGIGGGNYGGKTFGLHLDALRNTGNPKYEALILRRTIPQITNPGGLWDEAKGLYRKFGAECTASPRLQARFPSGARISFSHMQRADDRYSWDGSQVPNIIFDQLEQFDEEQWWYMLSRNRSASGVKSRMRFSCNPKPKCWLSVLLQWWWNPKTGYAIPERSGVVRWFVRIDNEIHWADSRAELIERFGEKQEPKSFTFITANIHDNKIGMALDPSALSNLQALTLVERERRLFGNWLIEESNDGMIKPHMWKYLDACPAPGSIRDWIRFWDIAAGDSNSADYSAGALMGIDDQKRIIIPDVRRGQLSPFKRDAFLRNTAALDVANGFIPQNFFFPGYGSGTDMTRAVIAAFDGYSIHKMPERGSKKSRADPLASQAEAGNVYLVRGDWNGMFVDEWAAFTGEESTATRKDDMVDASSGAYNQLARWSR